MLDRDVEVGESTVVSHNPFSGARLSQQRRQLPVFRHRDAFLYAVETHRTVVVVGETGCGKSTQLPQYLDEAGWTAAGRRVVCTQPRRVAAMAVASRVAEEKGVRLGTDVGYTVRFDDKSDPSRTRIKFVTDGVLLREIMLDPLLAKYVIVVVFLFLLLLCCSVVCRCLSASLPLCLSASVPVFVCGCTLLTALLCTGTPSSCLTKLTNGRCKRTF